MRPVIGVPCAVVVESWFGPTFGNYVSYLRALEAAGAIPQLIHLSQDEEVLHVLYSRCDGMLFAGGDDLHPARYNEPPHPKLGETSPLQDEVELRLFERVRADGKPVLGICRGLQLLNVALGGTLYQDLAAQRPGSVDHKLSDTHRDWRYLAHSVSLDASSWLAGRLDCSEILVNSLHHQGIKDLAPGLRVTAVAPDGLPEAIESDDGQIVAVQCHPEELWEQADRRWASLFQGFVERCTG